MRIDEITYQYLKWASIVKGVTASEIVRDIHRESLAFCCLKIYADKYGLLDISGTPESIKWFEECCVAAQELTREILQEMASRWLREGATAH